MLLPFTVGAADFDPDYLISDTELANHNSLDLSDIQRFLDKRNGTLKGYVTLDKEGNLKTAVQAFFEVAQKWLINPKYLLVLVQKEQSLLEDTNPSQGQYDRATGYGCPDTGGCDDRWKGFYRQVNSAAAQTRYYLDNINEFTYQPGKAYNIDGQSVTPKNTATAGLYNYTPHLHGNQNFWNLWNQYFGKKWPNGALLQAEGDASKVYLIENEEKREIISKAVFASRFDSKKIITVGQEDLDSYDSGVPIKYLNFSLLKSSRGDIYMIVDDQKRKIASQEVFKKIGFMEDEVIPADDSELGLYKDGPEITSYTLYPAGTLLQDSQTKQIFYVISGKKRPIINKEILAFNFNGLPVKKVSPVELESYRSGNPVTLPDGELVKIKGANTVYVISNGKRLPIFNAKIFEKMNYKWTNVKTVSKETLEVHELGQTITGDW
ncbi:MAG: hypothetical protein WC518_02055 [Patescibacteria group bacterium]